MQNDITIIVTDLLAAEQTQRILKELGKEYPIALPVNIWG